jgi:hypothetical protein
MDHAFEHRSELAESSEENPLHAVGVNHGNKELSVWLQKMCLFVWTESDAIGVAGSQALKIHGRDRILCSTRY